MIIREARKTDAAELLISMKEIDSETPFMLLDKDERKIDVTFQEKIVSKFRNTPNKLFLVAILDRVLVGYAVMDGGLFKKNKHCASVVLGVRKEYWGIGIGHKLLSETFRAAKKCSIKRLELTVQSNNYRAIGLYIKLGFEIDGIRKKSINDNGIYRDEYYMSKFVNDN